MNSVMFACTALTGTNKVGELKPDADGYRDMVVGALDVFNSAGSFYVYEEAKHLFDKSSAFIRRVQNAALRAEVGHPQPPPREIDPRLQRLRDEEYARRCMSIDDTNVCAHHRRIWIDTENVRDPLTGKPVIAIMSSVIPSGAKGAFLEKQLQNPHENVCFSIRAFTNNRIENRIEKRVLNEIVTFDYVNEPGISVAKKYMAPSLESITERTFSRAMLEDALYKHNPGGASMEHAFLSGDDLFKSLGWTRPVVGGGNKPAYVGW